MRSRHRPSPFTLTWVLVAAAAHAQPPDADRRVFLKPVEQKKDVPYVPTPTEVVGAMISLAQVRAGDVVYDLGCGDGRIVIAAVRIAGVRGVCVDIDPERIRESRQNAERAGVAGHIRFVQGDLFKTPIADATVVMMYLLPDVNLRLRPRLLAELRPGTRIVSHAFSMGDWKPRREIEVGDPLAGSPVYLWVVPARSDRPDRPRAESPPPRGATAGPPAPAPPVLRYEDRQLDASTPGQGPRVNQERSSP